MYFIDKASFKKKYVGILVVLLTLFLTSNIFAKNNIRNLHKLKPNRLSTKEEIIDLLNKIEADSILKTINDLVEFQTRYEYSQSRKSAGDYLYSRFLNYGYATYYDDYQYVAPLLFSSRILKKSNDIWIVGDYGLILKSTDKGLTWQQLVNNSEDFIRDICFVDSLHGWCNGLWGRIYKTSDNGQTWLPYNMDIDGFFYNIVFTDTLNGWICGRNNDSESSALIINTTDGGNTWEQNYKTSEINVFNDIEFASNDSGWAIGGDRIFTTRNKGANWSSDQKSGKTFTDIDFVNHNIGWISAFTRNPFQGIILKTIDGGQNWDQVFSLPNVRFGPISFLNEDIGFLIVFGNDSSYVYYTENGGNSWDRKFSTEWQLQNISTLSPKSCITNSVSMIYQTLNCDSAWSTIIPDALTQNSSNIVAKIEGTDHPDSVIILGAHYDSISEDFYRYAPGADDHASGVACIVEIARILKDTNPKYSIEFIAFSSEEVGWHGSEHYASLCKIADKKITAFINIDQIAYNSGQDFKAYVEYDALSSDLSNRVASLMETYTNIEPIKYFVENDYGDAKSFRELGFRSISFNHYDWNPTYHTTADELSAINIEYEYEITKGALATAIDLGDILETSINNPRSNQLNNFLVFNNYPNPFNPSTTIHYYLPRSGNVNIELYNNLGQIVKRIYNDNKNKGYHKMEIEGECLSSGVYYYKVQYNDRNITNKCLLIK